MLVMKRIEFVSRTVVNLGSATQSACNLTRLKSFLSLTQRTTPCTLFESTMFHPCSTHVPPNQQAAKPHSIRLFVICSNRANQLAAYILYKDGLSVRSPKE